VISQSYQTIYGCIERTLLLTRCPFFERFDLAKNGLYTLGDGIIALREDRWECNEKQQHRNGPNGFHFQLLILSRSVLSRTVNFARLSWTAGTKILPRTAHVPLKADRKREQKEPQPENVEILLLH
jgi:hypothetical protein